ncbi:MAG: glycosyltransferase family 2 protein [Desulfuromonadales bacterium]|nr:glycosyltransferase family 2 protein [Desulfuromonadales bacterium]MDW7757698.1 glycosyltransferase family 2 protein [Desulfuromonadales bacterium]
MIPDSIGRYLRRRSMDGPWKLEGATDRLFAGAVVIPALAEGDHLFATLESLAGATPPPQPWLIIVVVNHRRQTDPHRQQVNRDDLDRLRHSGGSFHGLPLAWVDAATDGRELPDKDGVGLARKIGFDLALPCLDYRGAPPLLASLDADTLVRPDYFLALLRHFPQTRAGAAVIPFCHQPADTAEGQAAIDRYELYLHHYALGLELAGSPYAFWTVGSALSFRAEAYARMGGMNRRQAGEDFYFLQQMAKTAGVARLQGTEVYPSPRLSDRTPFGTGPTVGRLLAGEPEAVRFYHPECFRLLARWLDLAGSASVHPATEVLAQARRLSNDLGDFLDGNDFGSVWERLQKNHPQQEGFRRAFHGWFDGLKTLQLIHWMSDRRFGRLAPPAALPPLLAWAGLPPADHSAAQLAALRRHMAGTST